MYMADEKPSRCFHRADLGARSTEGSTEVTGSTCSIPLQLPPGGGGGEAEEGASHFHSSDLGGSWVKQCHVLPETGGLQPCSVVHVQRGLLPLTKPFPVNANQVT